MRYLSDTTFLIDLVSGDEGALKLAEELDSLGEEVALSTVSALEYLRGIYYLYGDKDRTLSSKLADAMEELNAFHILPVDLGTALKAAKIESSLRRKGVTIGLADILIASTALQHNLILITRNTKHFKQIEELKIREY